MFKNKIYNKILFTILMIFIAMIISSNTVFADTNKIDFEKEVVIKINNPTIEYTGRSTSPGRTVRYNGNLLREGRDFKVTYDRERIEVGTIKMTFTGIGDFEGSVTKEFEIKRVDLSTSKKIKISNFKASNNYTGSEITQDITLKNGSIKMTEGTDYTLSFENNKEVGTASIIITGMGNYTGTLTKNFYIIKTNIRNLEITYPDGYYYTGNSVKPKVTIKNQGNILQEGIDFSVTYFNNVESGNAKMHITGIGNYIGVIEKKFTINKTPINNDEAIYFNLQYYNPMFDGNEKKPRFYLEKIDNDLYSDDLKEGKDYTVTYQNNINPGEGCIVITGIGNYTGTRREYFNIERYDISEFKGTLKGRFFISCNYHDKKYAYNDICFDGYIYDFLDCGIHSDFLDNCGIKVDFNNHNVNLGNFTLCEHVDLTNVNIVYLQVWLTRETIGYHNLEKDVDYTVTYERNYNNEITSIIFTGIGKYQGSYKISIKRASPDLYQPNITLSQKVFFYDRTERKPKVNIKIGTLELEEGTDYTVTYRNNVNVGTGIVEIYGERIGKCVKEFEIRQSNISGAIVDLMANDFYVDARVFSIQTKGDTNYNIQKNILKEKIDYEVNYHYDSYGRLKSIEIEGINNYTGSIILVNNDVESWKANFTKDCGYTDSAETIYVQKLSKEMFEQKYYSFSR